MRLLPASTFLRVAATLALAGVAIVVLDFAVKRADAVEKSDWPPVFAAPTLPPPVRLAAISGRVLLGTSLAAVPPGAAPVVQVFADGSYALRRPSPLPTGPEPSAATAAIVLPTGALGQLDSRARATFAEILGALIAERPVVAEKFVTLDFVVERAELERLLAWVR